MEKLKVLIAIDDPELAKIIVNTACSFIDKNNSEITLINIEEISLSEEEYFYRKPEKFIEHEAEKSDFAFIENSLENEGYNYKGFLYKEGNASKVIIDTAQKDNYDLIVVGSHNKHTFERLFLGSVSYKVSKYSKKPVLVVKPTPILKKNLSYNVLFCTDGSEYSSYASQNIGKFIDKKRANISILNVTFEMEQIIPPDAYIYIDMAKIIEESNLISQGILREAAVDIAKQGFTVCKKYHLSGDPASAIINEAKEENVDLLVLGSHGQAGIADWLLGSASSRVFEYSPVPVLIIKNSYAETF